MTRKDQLPASVSTAWGLRESAARPRARGLSLGRIVEAGIRVATSDGLAAVSMNRVAAELGAAPMSLYRHLTAKDELLAHMMDTAFAQVPDPPAPGESWRAGLDRWASAHMTIVRRHPWLLRIPVGGPPLMPNHVLWFERGLACLRDTRLEPAEKPSVLLLIDGYVRSRATLEADLLIAARASGVPPEEAGLAYSRTLSQLADAGRFPAVRALLEARVFDGDGTVIDDFRFGLERILDGIDVLVRARQAGTASSAAGERKAGSPAADER
jgi:AcrR family transcriptional regulator